MTHNPGTGKLFPLPADIQDRGAVFGGAEQCYRYRLWRRWDTVRQVVLFVMMNPSTANVDYDDRTVAKCGRYARTWGYGGLCVGNVFAYRCTDQKRLAETKDPVGPENDFHIIEMAKMCSMVVLAYGKPTVAALRARGVKVEDLLLRERKQLYVLRLCKDGTPMHPLYLPGELRPVELKREA